MSSRGDARFWSKLSSLVYFLSAVNLKSQKESWPYISIGHFWIASPIPEASGYCSLLEQDMKCCGLIIRWHGHSSKSTCHFSKSGTCKHVCVCWTLTWEGNRQQLAMLFVKQSVDPLPRDGEKPDALPVVPREQQRVPNTRVSSTSQ